MQPSQPPPVPRGTGVRVSLQRRYYIFAGIGVGAILLVAILLLVIYPRVGAWMIRGKVGDKLAAKLGRDVSFGSIDVSLGHATLYDINIRGPRDGDTPLVHVDRADVEFDTLRSFVGSVKVGDASVDGIVVTVRRDATGADNVRDIIDRLREDKKGDGDDAGGGFGKMRPTALTVTRARLLADDAVTGTTLLVADGDARWTDGGSSAHLRGLSATTIAAPKAAATKLDIEKKPGEPPTMHLDGGEISLWPKMALSGIGGSITSDPSKPGDYVIDFVGGYGGVPGRLWTAKGAIDAKTQLASIDLEAAKFQLDRLAPILEHSAVVDYQATSVDTKLHLEVDPNGARFAGQFHLRGLNVGHPLIAEKEVHDLDLSGQIAGSYDRTARKLELSRGDFITRNVSFAITGSATVAQHAAADAEAYIPLGLGYLDKKGPRRGPNNIQSVKLRLVIPPVDCQRILEAIPAEMAPYFVGYKLRGVFDTDIVTEIDWADLDATVLDGHVGIRKCRVVDEPSDSPKRLKNPFDHYVEVEKGDWISFEVGPENKSFVPLDEISPYVIKSIMSTEDSAFYQHHGFIPSEFKTALINNLKAGQFVQGASSITMQMVKNVLLYREKTLARKLQELYLTWHVENTLTKDRIMEIYLNVIEYGPGLYGIGNAAQHYFGKNAKDLNPVEAAFFSSILPDPKGRYKQYCEGTLTKWTSGKIERILDIMHKRDRLTDAEYQQALATPLLFNKDGSETEEDCLKRVRKAIKNSRSTNPLKRDDKPPKPKPKKRP